MFYYYRGPCLGTGGSRVHLRIFFGLSIIRNDCWENIGEGERWGFFLTGFGSNGWIFRLGSYGCKDILRVEHYEAQSQL